MFFLTRKKSFVRQAGFGAVVLVIVSLVCGKGWAEKEPAFHEGDSSSPEDLLRKTLEELRISLDQARLGNETLKDKIAVLRKRIELLRAQRDDSLKEIQRLTEEKKAWLAKVAAEKEAIGLEEERNANQIALRDQILKEREDIEAQIFEASARQKRVKEQIVLAQKNLEVLEKKKLSAKPAVKEDEEFIRARQKWLAELKALKHERTRLSRQLAVREKKLRPLEARLASLKNRQKSLTDQIQALRKSLEGQMAALKEAQVNRTLFLSRRDDSRERFEPEIRGLQEKKKNLEKFLAEGERLAAAMRTADRLSAAELRKWEKLVERNRARIEDLKKEVTAVTSRLSSSVSSGKSSPGTGMAALAMKKAREMDRGGRLEAQKETLQAEMARFPEKEKELVEKVRALERQWKDLTRPLSSHQRGEDVKRQIAKRRKELFQSRARIQKAIETLVKGHDRYGKIQEETLAEQSSLAADKEAWLGKIQTLNEEETALRHEKDEIQNQAAQNNFDSEIDRLRFHRDELRLSLETVEDQVARQNLLDRREFLQEEKRLEKYWQELQVENAGLREKLEALRVATRKTRPSAEVEEQ